MEKWEPLYTTNRNENSTDIMENMNALQKIKNRSHDIARICAKEMT
jgi:hypothetical protein